MRLATLFLLFLFSIPAAHAGAGLLLPPEDQRTFYFEPEKSYEWTWHAHRAGELKVYLGGDLEEYGTLHDPNPDGGPRDVTFELDLPSELEPGTHELMLYVEESRPEGQVGGVARVGGRITIISLFPEPYADMTIEAHDVAQGDVTRANIELTSWSEEQANVYAQLDVKDTNGTTVLEDETNLITLESREQETISHVLQTQDLPAGSYIVEASLEGAQEDLRASNPFRIGTLEVSLQDYTKEFATAAINKFEFTVASNWNEQIEDIRGVVQLLGEEERTPSVPLRAFGEAELSTFIDLEHVENETIAEGTLIVEYGAGSQEFPIEINISDEVEPTEERPGFVFELNQITGLYLALALLVLFNVILLLRKRE